MDSSHFFADIPAEERAAIMESACEKAGVSNFFDLTPEERADVYDSVDER
jgi:hypothetical protein